MWSLPEPVIAVIWDGVPALYYFSLAGCLVLCLMMDSYLSTSISGSNENFLTDAALRDVTIGGSLNEKQLRLLLSLTIGSGVQYPCPRLFSAIRHVYSAYLIKPSKLPGAGNGLFTKRMLRPGTIVGVYGGSIGTRPSGSYVMQVQSVPSVLVDGRPSGCYDHTLFGYINEDLSGGNNCKLLPYGLICTTTRVPANSELLMSYGESYNWDHVILGRLPAMVGFIRDCATALAVDCYGRELDAFCADILSWTLESLPLRRRGAAMHRLVLGVFDERVCTPLSH